MRTFAITLALMSSGCGLLFDPCGDLEERICADLGPADCEVFRTEPSIRNAVIPRRRRKAERAQCEMFAADVNYEGYTLPHVRHLIALRRDPTTPAPRLSTPQAVDGIASGVSSNFFYCLPFLVIPMILFVGWRSRRNLAAMQASSGAGAGAGWGQGPGPAPAPGSPGPGPQAGGWGPPSAVAPPAPQGAQGATWDHVASLDDARQAAAAGILVAMELVPVPLGGLAVPENVVFLPPDAAHRKQAFDREVASMVHRGEAAHYAAEPRYRGASFVPAAVLIRVTGPTGARDHRIDVW